MPTPSVAGLVARWRASDLALTDGSAVTSWTDAASGFVASQGTTTAQPTYRATGFNGHPGVEFDGTADYLQSTSQAGLLAGVSGATIIAAVQLNTTPSTGTRNFIVVTNGTGATSARFKLGPRTTRAVEAGGRKLDADTYRQVNGSTALTLGAYTVIGGDLDYANNAAHAYVGGALDGTAAAAWGAGSTSSATDPLNVWIGGQSGGSFMGGVIAEILVYDHVLSDADRAIVDSYLADTYGLTVSDYNPAWNGSGPSGGSAATLTTTASGGGVKHATGGSAATLTTTVNGGGHNGSFVPLRILEVVGDPTNLAADSSGQNLYGHWTAAGHTVTLIDDAASAPAGLDTDYDLVWVTNSVPTATNLATLGYDTATIPVIATGVRSPHTGYASATATTPATTQDTIYLKAAGVGAPMTPADLTTEQTLTVLTSPYNQRYTLNTALGSGVHEVAADAAATLNHITWSYYEAGDAMATGTAPGKRAWFLFHPGSGPNARGWQFMDGLLDWAAPKHASGGSATTLTVTTAGAGTKAGAGGAAASTTTSGTGAGDKATTGGASTTTTATTAGAGAKGATAGATVTVTVTVTGDGLTYRFGGSAAALTTTVTGGGQGVVPGQGGSTVTVTTTPAGAGVKTASAGSGVTVTFTVTGGGVAFHDPSGFIDVRVLAVVDRSRVVTIMDRSRTVSIAEHPRTVTITDRS